LCGGFAAAQDDNWAIAAIGARMIGMNAIDNGQAGPEPTIRRFA